MLNDAITTLKQGLRAWLLSDEFQVLLDELSTDLGFEVPSPAIVYTHERATQMPEAFPAVELLGLSSAPQGPPQGQTSVQHYHHSIDVLWTVAGDNEARVVETVEALILATRRMSYRQVIPMPDGTTAPALPGVENYGPLVRPRLQGIQPLVKGATIRVTIPTLA